MALSPNTLANELAKNEPTDREASAIEAFANAFEVYFGESMAGVIPASGSLVAARAAMASAMTGMSLNAAAAIQIGTTAFWGVVASSSAAIWPGTLSATPPPGLGGVAAAILVVAPVNVATSASKLVAWSAIASAIHPLMLGGTAVLPLPASPVPIL